MLEVRGLNAEQIGDLAARNGFVLHELTPQQASLEEAFMDLTRDAVEFRPGRRRGGAGMSAVAGAGCRGSHTGRSPSCA